MVSALPNGCWQDSFHVENNVTLKIYNEALLVNSSFTNYNKRKLTVQTIAQASQAQVGYFPLVDYRLVACKNLEKKMNMCETQKLSKQI